MRLNPIPCLVLACGNTLREDDGIGPWLAKRAGERFPTETWIRILAPQQWTPELAEEIARAQVVIFVDCAAQGVPGQIRLTSVEPAPELPRMLTHHLSAADLLAMSQRYFDAQPQTALMLTVGAGSLDLREGFSAAVESALPDAANVLEATIRRLRNGASAPSENPMEPSSKKSA
ncbi:MAG TPA: hydrogenase maturation protease [Terracidiphilus sp.]|nr:hydrogenase maturation protease [Terracidiphilus sp.]